MELPRNLLKSAAEFMKYFRGILENLPRKTGGTAHYWLQHLVGVTICSQASTDIAMPPHIMTRPPPHLLQEVAVGERIVYWIRTPQVPGSRPGWYGTFY